MPTFRIVVKIYAPYPIESEHIIKASKSWTAAGVAVRNAYKGVAHKRRIESYSLTITRL